jgi:hypothetical protein
MYSHDTDIAFNRFLNWLARAHPPKRTAVPAEEAKSSASLTFCLFLIYYFSLCDFLLKFLPLDLAIVLRYLPEAALYVFVLTLLLKQWRMLSFPLFWPLCACAISMAISVVLNSSSIFAFLQDYRLFFRFSAFAYIGWRTAVTPQSIVRFLRGFLGLTIIELIVGGLELIGGEATQDFFSPVLGLISGAPAGAANQIFGENGFIFGTLSDYNQFGNFMTTSCVLSLALYFIKGSRRYLWLTSFCVLAVLLSFSRHSLLLLVFALGCIFLLRSKRIRLGTLIQVFIGILVLLVALVTIGGHFDPAFEDRVATIVTPEVLEGDPAANMRLYITLILPPRFLKSYPFFGQGPIAPSDVVQFGETDTGMGPPLKAAPELPGFVTYYLGDVVWVMILGLYGCCGLTAFGYVLWSIAAAANKVRKQSLSAEATALAQACLATIVVFVLSGFFSEEMVARDCIPVFWVLAGLVFSLAMKPSSKTQALSRIEAA